MLTQLLSKGKLEITEDVISMIVLMCIKDIDGIEVISYIKDDIRGIFHKNYYKGVLIENTEKDVKVILKLAISNPKNIIDTCIKLQEMIVGEIKHMTGITIDNLTIKVERVQI